MLGLGERVKNMQINLKGQQLFWVNFIRNGDVSSDSPKYPQQSSEWIFHVSEPYEKTGNSNDFTQAVVWWPSLNLCPSTISLIASLDFPFVGSRAMQYINSFHS